MIRIYCAKKRSATELLIQDSRLRGQIDASLQLNKGASVDEPLYMVADIENGDYQAFIDAHHGNDIFVFMSIGLSQDVGLSDSPTQSPLDSEWGAEYIDLDSPYNNHDEVLTQSIVDSADSWVLANFPDFRVDVMGMVQACANNFLTRVMAANIIQVLAQDGLNHIPIEAVAPELVGIVDYVHQISDEVTRQTIYNQLVFALI